MGTGNSLCYQNASVHSVPPVNRAPLSKAKSTTWKQAISKDDARIKYEEEGTVPIDCSASVIELRCFLEEPVLLKRFGTFAKELRNLEMVMCWTEIMEFRSMQSKGFELVASKALYIFHKYFEQECLYPISGLNMTTEEFEKLKASLNVDISSDPNARDQYIHIFDDVHKRILVLIHDVLFVFFKKSRLYNDGIEALKKSYNRIDINDFLFYESLGKGAFGCVVRCKKKSTGMQYAMKILTKTGLLDSFNDCPSRVTDEMQALKACRHPFIISMDYAFQTKSLALMVVDLGTNGTLLDSLRDCPNLMMAEERVLFYAAEIALALSHIHSMGMIYRDLKPANVLLCSNGHIQLTDMGGIVDSKGKVLGYAGADGSGLFEEYQDAPNPTTDSNPNPLIDIKGAMPTMQVIDLEMSRGKSSGGSDVLDVPRSGFDSRSYGYGHSPKRANSISVSRYSDSALARATSLCGTSGYMAPEMFAQHLRKDAGYTNAIDYWSLGVLMYRLLVGTVPFPGNHVETFVADVAAQPRFNSEGQRYYPASYLAMYQKFRAVPEISETTIDLVTSFLEIIDMDRLGYGLKGLHKIKRHVGFKNIKWNLLIQKLVEPPFIPTSFHEEYIGSIQPFDSFEAMMRDQNRVGWLCMPVTATEQSYFQSWDFITADILKKEMGLTEMTEESHRSFRQSLRNSPHYEKPSFLSTIIEQPGSFFSRSSTFTRTVSSEKVLSMTSPVNILAAIGESDG